jgi:hypothetical protein
VMQQTWHASATGLRRRRGGKKAPVRLWPRVDDRRRHMLSFLASLLSPAQGSLAASRWWIVAVLLSGSRAAG